MNRISETQSQLRSSSSPSRPRSLKKQVRIVKKVRTEAGVWRFICELALGGRQFAQDQEEVRATRIPEAIEVFKTHIRTHSPAKPRTLERYNEVLAH